MCVCMCSVFESCQCSTQIQTFRLLFTALKGAVFTTIIITRSAKLAPPPRAREPGRCWFPPSADPLEVLAPVG